MSPAFRTRIAAISYVLLLICLVSIPILLGWLPPLPRVELYKSAATTVGDINAVQRATFEGAADVDIAFLGTSLTVAGVEPEIIRTALSKRLQRAAEVDVLALNWPGLDLQYLLLREYLEHHRLKLLVWNMPQPHASAYNMPHIQLYRWVNARDSSDLLDGLGFREKVALYGEMIIGAPRQLLSRARSNGATLTSTSQNGLSHQGYLGSDFLPASLPPAEYDAFVSDTVREVVGPTPGSYQMHFAHKIVELARAHHCQLLLVHFPLDSEYGSQTVPELADWSHELSPGLRLLAIPASRLFANFSRADYLKFFRDQHFNANGAAAFTTAITPYLIEYYEETPAT